MDYHATFDDYLAAKLRLFTQVVKDGGVAVVNADAAHARAFSPPAAKARGLVLITVGLLQGRDHPSGSAARIRAEARALTLRHAGKNPSSGFAVGRRLPDFECLGRGLGLAIAGLAKIRVRSSQPWNISRAAPGRMEKVAFAKSGALIYVDYAHTPDLLEKVLAAHAPAHGGKTGYVVFGCGSGDRDKGKRPLMGAIAVKLADDVIVTDDNPRSEDPATIRGEIMAAATGRARNRRPGRGHSYRRGSVCRPRRCVDHRGQAPRDRTIYKGRDTSFFRSRAGD